MKEERVLRGYCAGITQALQSSELTGYPLKQAKWQAVILLSGRFSMAVTSIIKLVIKILNVTAWIYTNSSF